MSIQVSEFIQALENHPDGALQFILPNGETIPEAYHITDVGVVTRQVIDCGGMIRNEQNLHLQLWLGADTAHRLTNEKALKIITLSRKALDTLEPEATQLKVEYQVETQGMSLFSLFDLSKPRFENDRLVLQLTSPHTTCLAKTRADQQKMSGCTSASCC